MRHLTTAYQMNPLVGLIIKPHCRQLLPQLILPISATYYSAAPWNRASPETSNPRHLQLELHHPLLQSPV